MNIYVGNLPYSTTEEDLRELFSQCGTVRSASIISDKMSGRSRGFAFVEMENDEQAKQAITKFNGTPLEGRNLNVHEARPREERPQRSSGFGAGSRGYGGGRSRQG